MTPLSSLPTSPFGDGAPTDAHLDAFAEGTLAPAEQARVAQWLDAALATEEAMPLTRALRAIPSPACPPGVAQSAFGVARADMRRARWDRVRNAAQALWLGLVGHARPAFAGATLITLIAVAGVLGRADRAVHGEAETVAQALQDAHLAFAYLGAVNERASLAVRQDVLDAHIARPLEAALSDPLGHHLD